MVGQINVLMALNDIGPGDGAPVLVPGSHKCTEIHPRLKHDGKGMVYDGISGKPAGTAFATQEIYLKAGDVVMFTDAITHGSAERTNDGYRRSIVYRYSPRYVRERFDYPQFGRVVGTVDTRPTQDYPTDVNTPSTADYVAKGDIYHAKN